MDKEYAIEVKNLSKSFKLPNEKSSDIKHTFINWTRGIKGYRKQKVLKNISFQIEKGDFFGIVGRNGSGKSTLLKLISGIYEPDKGSIMINGSLVSFIELGVGFNGELTGRENVYLNGALLGFSTKEISDMYDEIVDFAELRDFMDQKLKNYSSGMQVRLAFSCAIRAKSDILVLDEVLAVGDEAFQRKCNDYFEQMKEDKSKTIVLVTHSMGSVKQYCNKAIMLRDGRINARGDSEDVADEYSLENLQTTIDEKTKSDTEEVDLGVKNLKAELLSRKKITQNDSIRMRVTYDVTKDIETQIDTSIYDYDKNISLVYDESASAITKGKGHFVLDYECSLPSLINNRTIIMYVGVSNSQTQEQIAYTAKEASPTFIIRRTDLSTDREKKAISGVIKMTGRWNRNEKNK